MSQTMAEQWEVMKEEVRNAANRLIDDFPEHRARMISYPYLAEVFCQLPTPTDMNSFYHRQIEMSAFLGTVDNERAALRTDRMFSLHFPTRPIS
ncbi:MAG TPA: hypothetical protein VHC22_21140 [Pirellulales bacterium]|nr:hypothetical protein [Pirellulales bacterium]